MEATGGPGEVSVGRRFSRVWIEQRRYEWARCSLMHLPATFQGETLCRTPLPILTPASYLQGAHGHRNQWNP